MSIEEQFQKTAEFVRNWEAGKKAQPSVLAKSYGLYKQGSVGNASGDAPTQEDKRAKFNEWVNNKGMSKEDAMAAYIKLVEEKKKEYGGAAKSVEEEFQKTAEFVRNWEAGKKAQPNVLAKSYSLYKQASVGDASGDAPTQMDKRAKFNEWVANKGMSKEDAMAAYIKFIEAKKREYGGA